MALLVPGLLAGSILMASAPQARPAQSPELLAAPADSGYRLGYTSTEHPTLQAAVPGQAARAVLSTTQRGYTDLDADTRGGPLVWVSQRVPNGESDLDGDLFLQRPGGSPVRLTNDPAFESQPAVSPDGSQVAFVSDRGGNDDVWLVQANGSGLRRLTDHPGEDRSPSWSPDGTRIAFSSTRNDPAGDIYVVSAAGGQPTRLTTDVAADTQPAWSPDGTRIAFTTTRFAPATARVVVTMPAGGGAVTRAVPAPWDSAEPAWAPDSQRLAFTTTRRDPAGDVYVVNGTTVTAVGATDLVEQNPTWRGAEVIYTAIDSTGPPDVWTADTNGQDRRNRTARPGFAENGPTFSPDGTKLAYSAEQPGGGARIIVADADGRNPRTLAPLGTRDGDRDTDPAWSPDANSIAFTRKPAPRGDGSLTAAEDESARVLAVGVTDGRLLGEVPMPAHLRGDDGEASWSPDGTRLAVSRTAALRKSILGYPIIDRPAKSGTELVAPQTVQTPGVPPKPDIFFLVDDTASMSYPGEDGSSVIGQLKARIPEVIANVKQEQPDARFGLATFSGEGDRVNLYDSRQQLTSSEDEMQAAVNTLDASSIYGTENWFYALQQIAHDQGVGFRNDSSRIVVLISDTYSMGKYTPDGQLITRDSLRDDLRAAGVTLIGVPVVGADFEVGLDNDPDGSHTASWLAQATGGQLTPDSQPGEMIEAITAAIRQVILTVTPVVERCDDGVSVEFFPNPARVRAGEKATFQEHVTVGADVPPGSVLHCTIRFDVNAPQPDLESRQTLTIRTAFPERPFVRVDDVTATATGPNGVALKYTSEAFDALGRRLITKCTPPPGQTFPVGQTNITCTATDGSGRIGQDVATITVVDPNAQDGSTRIWLTQIASATVSTLSFGDQQDLSVRTAQPCRTGLRDRGPAWSPDGTVIAFADSSELARLCVVKPDGSGARNPIGGNPGTQSVADPAWTPDGSRIAVTLVEPGTSNKSIATLPSGGGTATIAIRNVGSQPTFQTLAAPDLTLSVSVGNQPGYVGGNTIPVTYTVRNTSRLPVANTWLDLGVPRALLPAASVDSRCDAGATVCQLGALGTGDQQVVTVVLPARAALAAAVAGRLTATITGGAPATRLAQAPIRVLAPTLVVNPAIGPPGFVTEASGTNFPPRSEVRLNWDLGITATPNTVRVNADGTFRAQVLILRKDPLGERRLVGVLNAGTPFGPVRTAKPFLVVARTLDPPDFDSRR